MVLWLLSASTGAETVFNSIDSSSSSSQIAVAPQQNGFLARIELNSPDDVQRALQRADRQFEIHGDLADSPPLAFVLHGPEVAIFFRDNYAQYKPIVDLAARLSALGVIELKVCRTRMGVLGRDPAALFPFVGTVPFGPAEVERLLKEENFIYF